MGDEAAQSRTAICSCQTAPTKPLWGHQTADLIRCRYWLCPECPKGLDLAERQEHWCTWAFAIDTRRGELCLDEVEPDSWFLLIIGTEFDLSCCCRPDGLTQPLQTCWVRLWRWELPKWRGAGPPRVSRRTRTQLRTGLNAKKFWGAARDKKGPDKTWWWLGRIGRPRIEYCKTWLKTKMCTG
jgi:hypothetical protein